MRPPDIDMIGMSYMGLKRFIGVIVHNLITIPIIFTN